MAFGWHFVDLDEEQKAQRRINLDIAANIAQYSALIPLLVLQIYFLFIVLGNRSSSRDGSILAPSFYLNGPTRGKRTISNRFRSVVTSFAWWAGTPIGNEWGTRGEWLFGAVWGAWLLMLSVAYTGNDYFHVTKRFGIVAASQLPLHYLLALKHPYSPLQLLTRLSHEELNRAHQVLARIISIFFYAHGILYLNSFIQRRILLEQLKNYIVLLGLLGLISFAIINTTSLRLLRAWSYRVFYLSHIILATLLLPILYFHVHHIRLYIWECLVIYLVNVFTRYASTRTYRGTVSHLPKTNLVKIDIPLPQTTTKWRAGDYVYLALLPQNDTKTPTDVIYRLSAGLRTNPFTVASIPTYDGSVTLVARVRQGNTKQLAALSEQAVKLRLEGPYGAVRYLPDLKAFDRILIVAGGIGATFGLPMYRKILHALSERDLASGRGRIKFLWLVKSAEDAAWALPQNELQKQMWENHVEVVVTGKRTSGSRFLDGNKPAKDGKKGNAALAGRDEIELEEREGLLDEEAINEESDEIFQQRDSAHVTRGRGRLLECVHETLTETAEMVAVLACGPPGMASSIRREVRRRAKQGQQVFFHAEEFGL